MGELERTSNFARSSAPVDSSEKGVLPLTDISKLFQNVSPLINNLLNLECLLEVLTSLKLARDVDRRR